ncbi:camp independent regulatory protein [Talaromyces stipitatus ATCC 10500]|uniref:Camp independent regulatory protein n=1 Tax=Talaromyces stipitatus (strain ATCC 10500 / CBS 375.48 / QM 6759 / NRRL 1006) TaxID=441959 RepID=B8MTV4_TALSN|nr:camp independent regulatory protein [Talaromyces stipitatus ATCC 10500]EED12497.1 camp independent regulatory protein [Talaromyces stipitatus ATCC 10500]
MAGGTAVLEPTYHGYVATTQDALILFEACLTGVLPHVPRRPHDRERNHLVRSGNGVTWSPSRILGNFLVYRELDKPFPPGEKKRAMKKGNRRPVQASRPGEPYPRSDSNGQSYSPTTPGSNFGDRPQQSDVERALVGSLVDSYGFKNSGLVKKTMSVTVGGITHHLVSYYSVEDVMKGILSPPSMHEELRYIRPRAELISKQSFRAPIDDVETGLENTSDPSQAIYGYRTAMIPTPTYGIQNTHSYDYMHSSPYGSHPSQPAPISSYASGPLPPQSASNPYLPTPSGVSQLSVKQEPDQNSYRSGSYGTAFDTMAQNHLPTTLPPTLNATGMSNSLDRHRHQQSSSPSIYRNTSMSARGISTDVTSPTEPHASATPYSRNSFGMPPQMDASNHQSFEQRNVAAASFDPTVPRREPNAMPSFYTGAADRQSYYPGVAHSNYPTAQPISTWTTTAPAQPQM